MAKGRSTSGRDDKVSRCSFLAYSIRIVVGGCGLAAIGCSESADDVLLPGESETPTETVTLPHYNCAWPETALLAKCEDGACHGAIAEKKRNFN